MGEHVSFLMPPEYNDYENKLKEKNKDIKNYIKIDIYSLGMSIIHAVYPFSHKDYTKCSILKEKREKINFFKSYYELNFTNILEQMVNEEIEK